MVDIESNNYRNHISDYIKGNNFYQRFKKTIEDGTADRIFSGRDLNLIEMVEINGVFQKA